jgi:hypothetical protein
MKRIRGAPVRAASYFVLTYGPRDSSSPTWGLAFIAMRRFPSLRCRVQR